LPCDDSRLTYKQFIAEIESQLKRNKYTVLPLLLVAALFDHNLRETQELLPRYAIDNILNLPNLKSVFQILL
jgi:hypothetical protein